DMLVRDVEVTFSDKTWKGFMEFVKGLLAAMTRTDLDYDIGKMLEDESKDPKDLELERRKAEQLAKRVGNKQVADGKTSSGSLAGAGAGAGEKEGDGEKKDGDGEKKDGDADAKLEGYKPRPASSDDRVPDIDWAIQDLDTDEPLYQ